MNVLVIDDDERVRQTLIIWLTRLGYEVDVVGSAKAGIELLKRHRYKVILLDYYMPRRDGLWFMTHAQLPKNTVSLMITGFLNRDGVDAMFKAGIRGYLAKPFSCDDLARHLEFYQHSRDAA